MTADISTDDVDPWKARFLCLANQPSVFVLSDWMIAGSNVLFVKARRDRLDERTSSDKYHWWDLYRVGCPLVKWTKTIDENSKRTFDVCWHGYIIEDSKEKACHRDHPKNGREQVKVAWFYFRADADDEAEEVPRRTRHRHGEQGRMEIERRWEYWDVFYAMAAHGDAFLKRGIDALPDSITGSWTSIWVWKDPVDRESWLVPDSFAKLATLIEKDSITELTFPPPQTQGPQGELNSNPQLAPRPCAEEALPGAFTSDDPLETFDGASNDGIDVSSDTTASPTWQGSSLSNSSSDSARPTKLCATPDCPLLDGHAGVCAPRLLTTGKRQGSTAAAGKSLADDEGSPLPKRRKASTDRRGKKARHRGSPGDASASEHNANQPYFECDLEAALNTTEPLATTRRWVEHLETVAPVPPKRGKLIKKAVMHAKGITTNPAVEKYLGQILDLHRRNAASTMKKAAAWLAKQMRERRLNIGAWEMVEGEALDEVLPAGPMLPLADEMSHLADGTTTLAADTVLANAAQGAAIVDDPTNDANAPVAAITSGTQHVASNSNGLPAVVASVSGCASSAGGIQDDASGALVTGPAAPGVPVADAGVQALPLPACGEFATDTGIPARVGGTLAAGSNASSINGAVVDHDPPAADVARAPGLAIPPGEAPVAPAGAGGPTTALPGAVERLAGEGNLFDHPDVKLEKERLDDAERTKQSAENKVVKVQEALKHTQTLLEDDQNILADQQLIGATGDEAKTREAIARKTEKIRELKEQLNHASVELNVASRIVQRLKNSLELILKGLERGPAQLFDFSASAKTAQPSTVRGMTTQQQCAPAQDDQPCPDSSSCIHSRQSAVGGQPDAAPAMQSWPSTDLSSFSRPGPSILQSSMQQNCAELSSENSSGASSPTLHITPASLTLRIKDEREEEIRAKMKTIGRGCEYIIVIANCDKEIAAGGLDEVVAVSSKLFSSPERKVERLIITAKEVGKYVDEISNSELNLPTIVHIISHGNKGSSSFEGEETLRLDTVSRLLGPATHLLITCCYGWQKKGAHFTDAKSKPASIFCFKTAICENDAIAITKHYYDVWCSAAPGNTAFARLVYKRVEEDPKLRYLWCGSGIHEERRLRMKDAVHVWCREEEMKASTLSHTYRNQHDLNNSPDAELSGSE